MFLVGRASVAEGRLSGCGISYHWEAIAAHQLVRGLGLECEGKRDLDLRDLRDKADELVLEGCALELLLLTNLQHIELH